jgi:perosamine synthetase
MPLSSRKFEWKKWPQYGEEEKIAVNRVIESNQLFAQKEVKAFEEQYADYLGVNHCLGLGNATQALHLSLAALNIGKGDEVLVTSYSWISTASCILMQNAVPVFCDIEEETLGLCPKDMESKISSRTKAVIMTHIFGYPAKIKEISQICEKHGLALIEDSSHAHGAKVGNKKIGTFGTLSVFSLHQRKSLSVGDGGLLCTNDEKIAKKVYRLRSFGDSNLSYNYRMTEFAGALGQVALKKLDKQNECRRKNAVFLSKSLENSEKIKVRMPKQNERGVFYAVLLETRLNDKETEQLVSSLSMKGVPISKTWGPLHLHPHFNVSHERRGIPWKDKEYDGIMSNIRYQELQLDKVHYYCPNRILELYVHPPNNIKNIEPIIKYLM